MATTVCTHCGEQKGTTRDHVFPTCLFVEPSNERSIKVPSCESCNCKSEEGLLKSFFSLFDDRLAETRLGDELLRPHGGEGDLRSFVAICTPDLRVAYPEEQVTRLLTKLFQGLRRYLLKDKWTFLPAAEFSLFSISKDKDHQLIRMLPLRIGSPNEGFCVPPAFEIDGNLEESFRDFRFGLMDDDVIAIRYARTFHGNELTLCAFSARSDESRHA